MKPLLETIAIVTLFFVWIMYAAWMQGDTGRSTYRWISSGDVQLTCWPKTIFNFWHIGNAPERYDDLYCIRGTTVHGYPWRP